MRKGKNTRQYNKQRAPPEKQTRALRAPNEMDLADMPKKYTLSVLHCRIQK